MLCQLSWFFLLCLASPPPSVPYPFRKSPHHCSCPWVMHITSLATLFPILYFTSLRLFCNYLFVLLNPLTSSPIPWYPLPSGNHQNALCITWFFLCSCLLTLFLDSIVDKYFCHFIVHSFDLLFLKYVPLTFHIIMVWWWWTPLVFFLSEKHFICPLILNESFAR